MATSRPRRVPAGTPPDRGTAGGWLRGIRVSGFSIVMMGLLILAVVILAPTLRVYIDQQQQIADIQASVAQDKAKLSDAKAERARWNDPSYIRSQARERLYYVMPGEISYLVIDDLPNAKAANDTNPVSKKIQSTNTNWLNSLFASGMVAGLGTKAPDDLQKPAK